MKRKPSGTGPVPWRNKRRNGEGALEAPAVNRFRTELDRTFERLLHGPWSGTVLPALFGRESFPSVDVSETPTEVMVRAETPGIEPKNLQVSLSGDLLSISGEKQEARERKEGCLHRSECSYGAFHRTVRLPAVVKAGKVEAEHTQGVLTIRFKKAKDAKVRRIAVNQDE